MTYAKGTEVAVEKTEAEIKATIRKYGATAFGSFEEPGFASVAFRMNDRNVMFKLPLPRQDDERFLRDGRNSVRSPEKRFEAWEQSCRERWRALLLCIKAKLESVEAGIETFEDAFLAHIQMGDGLTVSQHVRPWIAKAYTEGGVPPLLPPPRSVN